MKQLRFVVVAVALCSFSQGRVTAQPVDRSGLEFFEKKIRPILVTRCYGCHSAQASKVQGGLWLDTRDGLRDGGNSGSPIVAGDPESSLLIKALRHTEDGIKMPPGQPLRSEIVADFEQWIRIGAPDPRTDKAGAADLIPAKARNFWSFRKPVLPNIPPDVSKGWARTPVDRFIAAKLDAAGITPSPDADKRTLLRRVSLDLIGLPPTVEEIRSFLADASPNAYEKVVDRLLASPHYGERWARHWMDVSRYADTSDGGSRFAFSYTYRDWLIRAINEDRPYNDFIRQQIAADQLDRRDPGDLAALGFITLGRSVPKGEHDMIDDRIDVVTRGLQGLTVTCARCHDHKFDPIPTRDYYSFYSIIVNSREPVEYPLLGSEEPHSKLVREYKRGMERRLQAIDEFKIKRHAELVAEYRQASWIARYMVAAQQASKMSNTEIERLSRERDFNLFVLRRWRDYLNRTRRDADPVFTTWHAFAAQPKSPLPKEVNPELAKALAAKSPGSLEDLAQAYGEVLAKFDGPSVHADAYNESLRLVLRGDNTPTNMPVSDFMKIRGPGGDDNIIRGLTDAVRSWQAESAYRGLPPRAMALEDVEKPAKTHVFVRGNPNNLGAEAPRQFLTVLSKQPQPFLEGSGRLGLARAIASEENPLTARVFVNRVWQWHFGRGIVATPSDFGLRGDPPSHPELLDYLAKRFMDEGWSAKKLHKWIVLSSVYRQRSADRAGARAVDPENKLLWRMNRQRLDYESWRDSTLLVSGQLDPTMGGLPYSLRARPYVPRRTIYALIERGRLPGELNTFDFANPESHVPTRYLTSAPQQALYLMNSPFIAEQVRHLMARADIQSVKQGHARVKALYRLVLGREPNLEEAQAALDYIAAEPETAQTDSNSATWQYGMGSYDEVTGKVSFEPFRYFTEQRWQPMSMIPQPVVGSASLSSRGGAPGEDPKHAVIRRWVAPFSGTVSITGELGHKIPQREFGDGVRARIVHSREGRVALQVAKNRNTQISVAGVKVERGDTIDFIVDCLGDAESDDFTWAPVVTAGKQTWDASRDFGGPAPIALNAWEKFAQVLLQTNEFAFVD
jgi:Protein of unknown function (DUF1553)/Protein of unknown function (DUF1549)/Planctomycete cytochrome C